MLFGSLACVGFGKTCLEILKQIDNPSFYTKVDKWSGIDIKVIECQETQKVKFKPKITNNIVNICLFGAIFLIPLFLWIFVPFFQKSIVLKLLGIFVMGLCFALLFINIFIVIVKYMVGENTYECAKILNEETSQED